MRKLVMSIAAVLLAAPVFAQSRSLEGTTVTLKMDMPASQQGVDVYPNDPTPINFRTVADRLKAYGIGVHHGQSIMITRVVPKSDHIEVQLGGGGYGTFGDILMQSNNAAPTVPYESKSQREKDLEAEAKYNPNDWERREARDDLERERHDRARENADAAVINSQAAAINRASEAQARAQDGSRFNIRYRGGLPVGAATPQSIMKALGPWVDFGDGGSYGRGYEAPPPPNHASVGSGLALRNGLTINQVENLLGPANKVNSRNEGSIETMLREYRTDDGQHVTAQFVGGVLIDYQIGPR